ncbi:hypothetical protein GF420_14050, partial [candidate division GN15 bacterium]|nr:hypothetical protein [candidate division GN15 bacterium]
MRFLRECGPVITCHILLKAGNTMRFCVLLLFTWLLLLSSAAPMWESPVFVHGEQSGDQFGQAITTVDFNADGYQDLAVAAPAADLAGLSSGTVYLYYGGPVADTIADLRLVGQASSFFGQALAPAGDFNDDGYPDLLVGAPFYDTPATSAGAVFLFYGGPTPDTAVDHIFTGEAGGDYLGIAVAGIGDFNADGFDDIAAGAYRSDWGAFENAGKTYIYYGGSPPDFSADHVLVGEADGERFGYALAAGEIDTSPGYDLAVGAYSYDDTVLNQGRIYLFSGGSSADSLADLTITGSGAGEKYGWSLATGVLNRDSWADLIMGSDGISVDTFATGQMLVFYGGASLDTQSDDQYWLNRPENDYLGYSVTSGFDISGDCCDDILVGMPGNDDKATDAGGAVLLRGDTVIAVDTTVYGDDMLEEAGSAVGGWPHYKSAPAFAIGAPAYNGFQGRLMIFRGEATSVNQPPQLTVPADTSIDVGHVLLFDVTATDPDGTVPALDAAD